MVALHKQEMQEPGFIDGQAETGHDVAQVEEDCMVGSEMLDLESCRVYRSAMSALQGAGVPFLVGGAFALERYTGIARHTKDFDVFVRRDDLQAALDALAGVGFETEIAFQHWLGKAYLGDLFVDVIFSSGNAIAHVDQRWFDNAPDDKVLGLPVKVCPPEEIIWSKSLVMERERYDGADVAHLLRACGPDLDWRRLISRFGSHWRVLFSHLILFGFVYPGERDKVPAWVISELAGRLQKEVEQPPVDRRICRGTIISRQQYLVDVEKWGYRDARQEPLGNMSEEEIAHWTAGIEVDGKA